MHSGFNNVVHLLLRFVSHHMYSKENYWLNLYKLRFIAPAGQPICSSSPYAPWFSAPDGAALI